METREIALWSALVAVALVAGWGLVRVSELQIELDAVEVRLSDQAARLDRAAAREPVRSQVRGRLGRDRAVDEELAALVERYELSDAQVEEVRAALDRFFASVDSLRERVRSGEVPPGGMRGEVGAARDAARAQIRELIGEEAEEALWEDLPRGQGMGLRGGEHQVTPP